MKNVNNFVLFTVRKKAKPFTFITQNDKIITKRGKLNMKLKKISN